MSARETNSSPLQDTAQRPTPSDESTALDTSITTSTGSIRSQEREISTIEHTQGSQDTEDEETESEIEMEMNEEDTPTMVLPRGTHSNLPETPPLDTELSRIDDTVSEEEEEDEAFPPVQHSPLQDVDEEAKEQDDVTTRSPVRHRKEPEEETKGDEDNEDTSPIKKGRPKSSVDVERDTELIRLLADNAERMAAAEKRGPVWEDLAKQQSHRFNTWRQMHGRLVYLQSVLRDPSHEEHGNLTDEMKRLMKVYSIATGGIKPPRASPKRRAFIGFVDPAKKRRKLAQIDRPPMVKRLQQVKSASVNTSAVEKVIPKPLIMGGVMIPEGFTLDEDEEAQLLRAAIKFAPEFRHTVDQKVIWDKIAEASNGDYDTGKSAEKQIRYLVKIFRYPTGPRYQGLTPMLRELLTKFLDAAGQPFVATEQKKPRVDDKATPTEKKSGGRSASHKSNGTVKKVTIRPKGDHALVQLVLEKRPFALSTPAATTTWAEIAEELAPTHPRITNATTAQERFKTVVKVFNDATHPNRNDLTKALREKLSKYNSIMSSYRAKLDILKDKTLQDDWSDASAEEVVISKPRALGEGADFSAPVASAVIDSNRTGKDSSKSFESEIPIAVEVENGALVRKTTLPLNVEADELLMRKILEKRPWTVDVPDRTKVWNEVVMAVKAKNPRIQHGQSAQGRVRTLLHMKNPSHPDHNKLSTDLLKMLAEYEELMNMHKSSKKERMPEEPSHKVPAITDYRRKRKESSEVERKESADTGASVLKRRRAVTSENGDNDIDVKQIAKATVELSVDDVLLLETLLSRPFHSQRSDGLAAWDDIASVVDRLTGLAELRTGQRAKSRVQRMLDAYRKPEESVGIQLSSQHIKMLKLVDELLNSKWPKNDNPLSDQQRNLIDRISRLVEEMTQGTSGLVRAVLVSRAPYKDDADDDQLPEMRIVPQSYKEVEKLRRQLVDMTRQRDALIASQKERDLQQKLRQEQVNALQEEVIRLRAAAASDRASFETQMHVLQDELTSCRTQLTMQVTRLEHERHEHREELRAMVDILQGERATHERDTAAMLAVVNREREDRREEFVAMMNLVTRSVLQAEEA